MQIKDITQVKIGMWASQCCHCDLHQISADAEIETILEDWDEGIDYDVWPTRREALLDIRKGFEDKKELLLIDKMLLDLQHINRRETK